MRTLFWFSLFLSWPAFAHQPKDGDIYATLGGFVYSTHEIDHQFDTPTLVSPVLIAEGDLDDNGGLEISMFYLRNSFSVKKDGLIATERIKRMYITMGYRHWFNDRFSGAISFFSSYSMGELQIMRDDFAAAERPRTSASDVTEYGFDFALGAELWRSGRFALVLDTRYAASVTAKRGEDSNHYGALIALKYFVQSREKIHDPDDIEF